MTKSENIKNNTENTFQGQSEGKNLTESYNWFKDPKVIAELEKALFEIAEELPASVSMLGLGSGQGLVERTLKVSLERKYNKKVSLVETDRDLSVFSTSQDEIQQVVVENKNLPFDEQTFDLIVARSVTHYEPTEELEVAVLNQINKVLKQKGVFLNETPYLQTQKEIELLYRIHNEFVNKPMNLKLKEDILRIHGNIFSKVELAVVQPTILLTVNSDSFKKRYNIDDATVRKITELIKEYNPSDIPNIYLTENGFGWTVPYLILVCRK